MSHTSQERWIHVNLNANVHVAYTTDCVAPLHTICRLCNLLYAICWTHDDLLSCVSQFNVISGGPWLCTHEIMLYCSNTKQHENNSIVVKHNSIALTCTCTCSTSSSSSMWELYDTKSVYKLRQSDDCTATRAHIQLLWAQIIMNKLLITFSRCTLCAHPRSILAFPLLIFFQRLWILWERICLCASTESELMCHLLSLLLHVFQTSQLWIEPWHVLINIHY